MISKWLLGDKEKALRNGTIWNTIASAEYSLQSALLLLVVTRVGGLTQAGIFTITYTVAQMMATIGSYAMRDFQSSDIQHEYSFAAYWTSRIITNMVMVFLCMGYAFLGKYSCQQVVLIALFCLYRAVDNFEDVLHGEMQREFRLDVAAKIMAIRILLATLTFMIVYVVTLNLLVSTCAFTIVAIIAEIWLSYSVIASFHGIRLKWNRNGVYKLLFTCFPLCAGGFLYNYLVSASKYAINRNMTEEFQSIFSILFMPIFTINMVSMFVYKPMIATLGQTWAENKRKIFLKNTLKLVAVIVCLTGIVVLGGYLIGLELLEWIYGVGLSEYRILFVVLLAFGGIAALDSFLVVILTIIRQQKVVVVAYGIGAVLNLFLADLFVQKFLLWGAGTLYGFTMMIVLIVFMIFILASMRRKAE